MAITPRNVTNRQATYDYQLRSLLLFNNTTQDVTYENISGGDEDVAFGQLMGVVAASGSWVVCKSGAADGSAIPRGVYCGEAIEGAANGATAGITIVDFGKINKGSVYFDGTDTWATLVGGIRMETLLVANSKGLELVTVNDYSEFDN